MNLSKSGLIFLKELDQIDSYEELKLFLKNYEYSYKNSTLMKLIAERDGIGLLLEKYVTLVNCKLNKEQLASLTADLLVFLINITYKEDTIRSKILSYKQQLEFLENVIIKANEELLYRRYSKIVVNIFSSRHSNLITNEGCEFVKRYIKMTNDIIITNFDPKSGRYEGKHFVSIIFISWIKIILYNKSWILEFSNFIDLKKYDKLTNVYTLDSVVYRYLIKVLNCFLNHTLFDSFQHIISMNIVEFLQKCYQSNPFCKNHQFIHHTISCGDDKCSQSIPFMAFTFKLFYLDQLHEHLSHSSAMDNIKKFFIMWTNLLTNNNAPNQLINRVSLLIYSLLKSILFSCNNSSIRFCIKRCSILENIVQSLSLKHIDIKLKYIMACIICHYRYDSNGIPLLVGMNIISPLVDIMDQLRIQFQKLEISILDEMNFNPSTPASSPNSNCENEHCIQKKNCRYYNSFLIKNKYITQQYFIGNIISLPNNNPTITIPPELTRHISNSTIDYVDDIVDLNYGQYLDILNNLCELFKCVLKCKYYQVLNDCPQLLQTMIANISHSPINLFTKNSYLFLYNYIENCCSLRGAILNGLPRLLAQCCCCDNRNYGISILHREEFTSISPVEYFYCENGEIHNNFFCNTSNISLMIPKYNILLPIEYTDRVIDKCSYAHKLLYVIKKKAHEHHNLIEIKYFLDTCTTYPQIFHIAISTPILYHETIQVISIPHFMSALQAILESMCKVDISYYYFSACLLSLSFLSTFNFTNADFLHNAILKYSSNHIDKPFQDICDHTFDNNSIDLQIIHVTHYFHQTNDNSNNPTICAEIIGSFVAIKKVLIHSSIFFKTISQINDINMTKIFNISVDPFPGYEKYSSLPSHQINIVFNFLHVLHGCSYKSSCTVDSCSFFSYQLKYNTDHSSLDWIKNYNKEDNNDICNEQYYVIAIHILILCDKYMCHEAKQKIMICFLSTNFTNWLLDDSYRFCDLYCKLNYLKVSFLQYLLLYYLLKLAIKPIDKLKIFTFIINSPIKENFIKQLYIVLENIVKLRISL